ncbi:hypothetical protein JKP88DRAFT_254675 [Tribonema minus]|uniref:Uncharacterized protein n=1 Tax=Tribonema minus TaxID=303371 RepID=A0A836CHZ5_9STRA|nr:hypothetical protein JKP88DRAFT_254675 [Tribonema minus]
MSCDSGGPSRQQHRRTRSDPVPQLQLKATLTRRSTRYSSPGAPLKHLRTPDLEEMAQLALERRMLSARTGARSGEERACEATKLPETSSTITVLHKQSFSPMSPVEDVQCEMQGDTEVCDDDVNAQTVEDFASFLCDDEATVPLPPPQPQPSPNRSRQHTGDHQHNVSPAARLSDKPMSPAKGGASALASPRSLVSPRATVSPRTRPPSAARSARAHATSKTGAKAPVHAKALGGGKVGRPPSAQQRHAFGDADCFSGTPQEAPSTRRPSWEYKYRDLDPSAETAEGLHEGFWAQLDGEVLLAAGSSMGGEGAVAALAAAAAGGGGGGGGGGGNGSISDMRRLIDTHRRNSVERTVRASSSAAAAAAGDAASASTARASVDAFPDSARTSVGSAAGGAAAAADAALPEPILVSLADVTAAGLEKLLEAGGDTQMYFDSVAQRWVGGAADRVDMSGFERGSTAASLAEAEAVPPPPSELAPLPPAGMRSGGSVGVMMMSGAGRSGQRLRWEEAEADGNDDDWDVDLGMAAAKPAKLTLQPPSPSHTHVMHDIGTSLAKLQSLPSAQAGAPLALRRPLSPPPPRPQSEASPRTNASNSDAEGNWDSGLEGELNLAALRRVSAPPAGGDGGDSGAVAGASDNIAAAVKREHSRKLSFSHLRSRDASSNSSLGLMQIMLEDLHSLPADAPQAAAAAAAAALYAPSPLPLKMRRSISARALQSAPGAMAFSAPTSPEVPRAQGGEAAAAAAADGGSAAEAPPPQAWFNAVEMRWEGFEEPDMSGFSSSSGSRASLDAEAFSNAPGGAATVDVRPGGGGGAFFAGVGGPLETVRSASPSRSPRGGGSSGACGGSGPLMILSFNMEEERARSVSVNSRTAQSDGASQSDDWNADFDVGEVVTPATVAAAAQSAQKLGGAAAGGGATSGAANAPPLPPPQSPKTGLRTLRKADVSPIAPPRNARYNEAAGRWEHVDGCDFAVDMRRFEQESAAAAAAPAATPARHDASSPRQQAQQPFRSPSCPPVRSASARDVERAMPRSGSASGGSGSSGERGAFALDGSTVRHFVTCEALHDKAMAALLTAPVYGRLKREAAARLRERSALVCDPGGAGGKGGARRRSDAAGGSRSLRKQASCSSVTERAGRSASLTAGGASPAPLSPTPASVAQQQQQRSPARMVFALGKGPGFKVLPATQQAAATAAAQQQQQPQQQRSPVPRKRMSICSPGVSPPDGGAAVPSRGRGRSPDRGSGANSAQNLVAAATAAAAAAAATHSASASRLAASPTASSAPSPQSQSRSPVMAGAAAARPGMRAFQRTAGPVRATRESTGGGCGGAGSGGGTGGPLTGGAARVAVTPPTTPFRRTSGPGGASTRSVPPSARMLSPTPPSLQDLGTGGVAAPTVHPRSMVRAASELAAAAAAAGGGGGGGGGADGGAVDERDRERQRLERRVERLRENQALALQRVAQVQELIARMAEWGSDEGDDAAGAAGSGSGPGGGGGSGAAAAPTAAGAAVAPTAPSSALATPLVV